MTIKLKAEKILTALEIILMMDMEWELFIILMRIGVLYNRQVSLYETNWLTDKLLSTKLFMNKLIYEHNYNHSVRYSQFGFLISHPYSILQHPFDHSGSTYNWGWKKSFKLKCKSIHYKLRLVKS